MKTKHIFEIHAKGPQKEYLALLQEIREGANLKKYRAATNCGCSPQTVSYVERGDRGVSLIMASQLALGIGRLPSRVMGEAEDRIGLPELLENLPCGES
jgi:DNA-binding XRE family transcriptional regulator